MKIQWLIAGVRVISKATSLTCLVPRLGPCNTWRSSSFSHSGLSTWWTQDQTSYRAAEESTVNVQRTRWKQQKFNNLDLEVTQSYLLHLLSIRSQDSQAAFMRRGIKTPYLD